MAATTTSSVSEERPPVISHAPSIWADTFTNSSLDDQEQQKHAEAIEAMKQDVRGMLTAAPTPLKQMILIDTLERLGLAYHFETLIEHKLQQISDDYIAGEGDGDGDGDGDEDLFTTALRFRLLRQHQHHISCNVFEKFVGKNGEFEETLSSDAEGLLSLYEAAHVGFRDEKILDDAAIFTTHHLLGMESLLKSPMKEKVKRALEYPLHRDIPIIYTRNFIPIYEGDDSRDELLLKLAKTNFNFLQSLYRDELSQLSRWWKKFDLKAKLAYARDRLVEAYIWGLGYHYEPQYSYVRMGVAKSVQMIALLDDTYDNYVTLNEAQLLTQILDVWSIDETDGKIPDFMKVVCHFVTSTCEDYERDAANQGKEFAAHYFKETVQQLARAYNQELKWVMEKRLPSFEDYARNSEITSSVYVMFAATIPGLKSATQETVDWMKSQPRMARPTAMIGRYRNDIVSHERENKGGKVLTVVDCYMKQHGVSMQETISKFAEEIENSWKDLNEEWSKKKSVLPKESSVNLLNYARICEAAYKKNGDGFTDPVVFEAQIAALFLHPILI